MYSWMLKARDVTWQKKMEDSYKGKQQPYGQKTKPGTFKSQNPGEIAKDLKEKSKDYGQASQKLSLYVNRTGRNLNKYGKQNVMDHAKEALKNAYGVQDEKKDTSTNTQTNNTTASPVLMPPAQGQNKEVPMLPTMSKAKRLRATK